MSVDALAISLLAGALVSELFDRPLLCQLFLAAMALVVFAAVATGHYQLE